MLAKKFLLTKKDIGVFARSRTLQYLGSRVRLRACLGRHVTRVHRARFAFVVSSKVRRNAFARNAMRRRMAEIVRHLQPNMKAGGEFVFFLTLHDKKAPSTKQLKDDIIRLLKQCGVL